MNWLAHLHLSEPTPEFRLGSLLPDLVSSPELAAQPAAFQPGIRRHLRIDAFTDAHPVFRNSVRRLPPPYRRFGGILVDVFYDHFLARHWTAFSPSPLPEFTAEVYDGFPSHWSGLSERVRLGLQKMQAEDWLGSYRETSGITATVERIGRRLRQPVDLTPSIRILEENHAVFQADFSAFYPELQAHVRPAD